MENASKALLIAGGMLILILILTFAVYMFGKIANDTSKFYEEMSETELAEYNQQYFEYDGRGTQKDADGNWINPLQIQDVVSIINLVKNNENKGYIPTSISVLLDGKNITNEDTEKLLKDNLGTKYSCKVEYKDGTNYVGKITINIVK